MSRELAFTVTLKDGTSKNFSLFINDENRMDSFLESLQKNSKEINKFILGKDVG